VWFFSFVRVGTAGSVDLRTNFSSSFGVFFAGVQGALGEWFGYQAKAWYEMGSIVLTNLSKPDPVSAWASEASLFVGKKGFPIQGRMRLFLASGEGKADGWNRFVPLGEMESSQVLLHPAGNLTLVQMQATWRTLASRLGVSLGYDLLWRQEKQDITLVSLYGDGLFLGQEFVLQVVGKIDPSVKVFATGGVFLKGDGFGLNRDKPLYQVSGGLSIEL